MVASFRATRISDTIVRITWQLIESDAVDRYTVYYYSTSEVKRQVDSGSKNFSANVSEGVIDGLDPNLDYIFSITVTFILGGMEYEGEETVPIIPIIPSGNEVWMLINVILTNSMDSIPNVPVNDDIVHVLPGLIPLNTSGDELEVFCIKLLNDSSHSLQHRHVAL